MRLSKKTYVAIVGVQKAATTSLYAALESHSQVCKSNRKEQHFFNHYTPSTRHGIDFIKDPFNRYDYAVYEKAWEVGGEDTKAYVDATPIYCFQRGCMNKLRKYRRDAKIIMIVRDPLDRALSQYKMETARGTEDRTITEVCNDYLNNKLEGSQDPVDSYIQRANYAEQLDNIYSLFKRKNIMVISFVDLTDRPEEVLPMIQDFIGLDYEVLELPHSHKGTHMNVSDSEKNMLRECINKELSPLKETTDFK